MDFTTTICEVTPLNNRIPSCFFDLNEAKKAACALMDKGHCFIFGFRTATHLEMVARYGPEYGMFMVPPSSDDDISEAELQGRQRLEAEMIAYRMAGGWG